MVSNRMFWPRAIVTLLTMASFCVGCMPSDDELRRDIRSRLDRDEATAGLSIEVQNRAVYLSGQTTTREEQERAMEAARSARGVKLVVNDMQLKNVALAEKVKRALASDQLIGHVPIEVDAQADTVRLMSDQTNQEQRTRAVQIASEVDGVGRVEDRMR